MEAWRLGRTSTRGAGLWEPKIWGGCIGAAGVPLPQKQRTLGCRPRHSSQNPNLRAASSVADMIFCTIYSKTVQAASWNACMAVIGQACTMSMTHCKGPRTCHQVRLPVKAGVPCSRSPQALLLYLSLVPACTQTCLQTCTACARKGSRCLPRTMAFLMEYLRHKITERMQSNEDLDEFWHNRINRNKEVAKKWCAPTKHAVSLHRMHCCPAALWPRLYLTC